MRAGPVGARQASCLVCGRLINLASQLDQLGGAAFASGGEVRKILAHAGAARMTILLIETYRRTRPTGQSTVGRSGLRGGIP